MAERPQPPPGGIPGVGLAGPFPVGRYATFLRDELRRRARVQLFGEVWNLRAGRGAKVYFELRDAGGALPCSIWRSEWDRLDASDGALVDGAQVVVAGGPDYYPGSGTASPAFSFLVTDLRIAGEGDLLAQVERLRRRLAAEGLLEPQRRLPRAPLPKTIGVVCGETGKARDDVLAALGRRGWAGRLVWAFAPVQDRHAAPRIGRALQDLAAIEAVEVIIVARGGGSLADLFAFCDETLCRTVALLRVPVIASVGHHSDRTLIDDVAAASCSTPTHAAEEAVPLHVGEARAALTRHAGRLAHHGRRSVLDRARRLAQLRRAPAEHVARHRRWLHQQLRELRASARRRAAQDRRRSATHALVLERQARRATGTQARAAATTGAGAQALRRTAAAATARRGRELERLALALAAHDPERTLERGYALVRDADGALVTSAARARAAGAIDLTFHDDHVPARVEPPAPSDRNEPQR